MKKYWVISPYRLEKAEVWERAWQFDLSHGTIAIGWRELDDISSYDKSQLEEAVKAKWPDDKPKQTAFSVNALWNFWHEIEVGDTVVARKGTKTLAAIGTVTQTAFYDLQMGKERVGDAHNYYPNLIRVQWDDSPRDIRFDKPVFAFPAIYKTTAEGYEGIRERVNAILKPDDERKTIVLEKYLQELVVSNFDKVFEGSLELYKTPEGDIAEQYPTAIGVIDVLAVEPETGSLVVIELKKGCEADKVVGQILRYMGWVDKVLCEDEQQVKGIIICEKADPKLLSALRMTPDIELKYYSIHFKLADVEIERSHR